MLVTRDRPWAWWFAAALFVSVALAFLYLAYRERYSVEPWQIATTFVIGMMALLAGLWMAMEAPVTTVELDTAASAVVVTRMGLTGRFVERYPLSEVAMLATRHKKDDEGDPLSQPVLVLANGTIVPLSMLWRHGTTDAQRTIDALQKAVPALTHQKLDGTSSA